MRVARRYERSYLLCGTSLGWTPSSPTGRTRHRGRGITSESGSDLLSVVDFLTLCNHAFDAGGAGKFLQWETRIIRPANLEADSPGYGWGMFEAGGVWVGVVNVQGRVFMKRAPRSPFRAAERAVDEVEAAGAGLVLVDVHAEATSEKQAMGYHLEGRRRRWSEPKSTHAHGPQTYELHFRALLTGERSELELIST